MSIEELKAKEAQLLAEYLILEKPLDAKRGEWLAIRRQRETLELRESIREQMRAELAQKPKAA